MVTWQPASVARPRDSQSPDCATRGVRGCPGYGAFFPRPGKKACPRSVTAPAKRSLNCESFCYAPSEAKQQIVHSCGLEGTSAVLRFHALGNHNVLEALSHA